MWGTGDSLAPTELGGSVLLGTGVTSMGTLISVTPGDGGLPASTATLCWRAGEVLLNYFKLKHKKYISALTKVALDCGMEGLGW